MKEFSREIFSDTYDWLCWRGSHFILIKYDQIPLNWDILGGIHMQKCVIIVFKADQTALNQAE